MILMIGAGPMAQEYAKVLNGLERDFVVVGRSEASAAKFQDATGVSPFVGGVDKFYESEDLQPFEFGIVTTSVEQLAPTTIKLIDRGIKNILVEKPAGLDAQEIAELADYAANHDAKVYVAYNRRFFSSLLAAKDIIEQDGGVQSFNFELTEWGHVIAKLKKAEGVKENWFLANTTHVTDMAFHLGGFPEQLSCFFSGGEDWHERSYNFSGAGVSDSGALFAYHGNWGAPGRWSVEVLTSAHRLIFRPMEKLQIQKLGSVSIEPVEVDDFLDNTYKPGLYKQTEAFLSSHTENLCSLRKQLLMLPVYERMAGY
ncbi:Gfo/Idh/MocA family oxidoreductase [Vibrio sp. 10N.222.54.F6]|uniref:Gfo/Idh/MocA family protein n=1 Tax=unclassified Vibrio TaxID=2614977 RepID=UPI000C85B5F3|nr:Gfo/Idh/MocA family oxidoreductase [Vibrio sp. 10N.261.51.A7]PML70568.1 myo-inositol 2-dehydrogenase [Vibrio sp. 10N.261.51.A7]